MSGTVVVLAGGTGGAKLARGMLDVVGAQNLVVIANTGDDLEIYGAYVAPDPDLITFWLADRIDERGWGLAGDTFNVMDGLRELGVEVWFNLGDRDLAIGLERSRALTDGTPLSVIQSRIGRSLGVAARVLPASDEPIRTRVRAHGRWWPFQEFMIKARGEGPVDDVRFHGARGAPPASGVLESIIDARAIVIGPSNPVISIGPILAIPAIGDALRAARAPRVAVSPLVGGQVVKGPTDVFMAWAERGLDSDGIADAYDGLIDGLVADTPAAQISTLQTDVLMDTPAARASVAAQALEFALALG